MIHPETRARVTTLAVQMGYQGRSRRGPLKPQHQRTIRVLFSAKSLSEVKLSIAMMGYLQGMTAECEQANISLNIHAIPPQTSESSLPKGIPQVLSNGQGEVLIISGYHDPTLVAKLAKSFPLLSMVHTYEGVNHDIAATDDLQGTRQMVNRLVQLSHRKLGWISFDESGTYTVSRRAGFLDGCVAGGLDLSEQVLIGVASEKGVLVREQQVLKAIRGGVTGIVAASDHAAYEVWRVLQRHGIDVPRDVSLTGFDAIGEPNFPSPAFTTFDPRFIEIGRAAIQLAVWRMENLSRAPLRVIVRGKFIEGATIGPARRKPVARTK